MKSNRMKEAEEFISSSYRERHKSDHEIEKRLAHIKDHIEKEGFYHHTAEELEYGAKLAWRNSNRCIEGFYGKVFM